MISISDCISILDQGGDSAAFSRFKSLAATVGMLKKEGGYRATQSFKKDGIYVHFEYVDRVWLIRAVHLYSKKESGFSSYLGEFKPGVTIQHGRQALVAALGAPSSSGGDGAVGRFGIVNRVWNAGITKDILSASITKQTALQFIPAAFSARVMCRNSKKEGPTRRHRQRRGCAPPCLTFNVGQRMKSLVTIAVLLFAGCVATPSKEVSGILGVYGSTQGGFNEQIALEVRSDGSYILQHHFIGDVIGSDGVFQNGFFGEERGKWALKDGILSLAASKIGADHSPMFLPAYCERFEVRADGSLSSVAIPAIPASVRTHIVLKKTPNQALQPTAPSRRG